MTKKVTRIISRELHQTGEIHLPLKTLFYSLKKLEFWIFPMLGKLNTVINICVINTTSGLRQSSGDYRKYLLTFQSRLKIFGGPRVIFGNIWIIFGNIRKGRNIEINTRKDISYLQVIIYYIVYYINILIKKFPIIFRRFSDD